MSDERDPFDGLLRAAMQRRPDAPAPADLPARAMRIAHERAAMIAPNRLRRFRLMTRVASLAAVAIIGVFVFVGVRRLADHGNLTLTPGNNWTDSSATTTGSATGTPTSTSSDSTTWSWIIMAGVVGLTGLGAAAVIRQSSPFAGAAGMTRFA